MLDIVSRLVTAAGHEALRNVPSFEFHKAPCLNVGWDSSVGITTGYELDGPRIESWWMRIFRTRSDRPWGSPTLLYNGYRIFFPGVKRPGRGVNHSSPSSAEFKE